MKLHQACIHVKSYSAILFQYWTSVIFLYKSQISYCTSITIQIAYMPYSTCIIFQNAQVSYSILHKCHISDCLFVTLHITQVPYFMYHILNCTHVIFHTALVSYSTCVSYSILHNCHVSHCTSIIFFRLLLSHTCISYCI
jgi:hypothetical protein